MILEPKTGKQKRSLQLIAEFVDGYAKGWYFAVGEFFKDELDIKFTTRVEPILKNGEKQYEFVEVKGGERKRLITKKVKRWTQGQFYCFSEGHVIYDTPKAYLPWSEALKHIGVVCSVIRATPNTLNNQNAFVNGQVFFKLSKPNQKRTGLDIIDNYHATQNEFVNFLKEGTFKGQTIDQLLVSHKNGEIERVAS